MQSGHHVISLSLGGPAKPSGLAVLEPRSEYWRPKGDESRLEGENHFDVVWLERLAAGRPYPAIVARTRELAAQKRLARGSSLLVDITATGIPPLRLFEDQGLYPQPFQVASAIKDTYQDGIQVVPLRDTITISQVALQSNRLKIASSLDLAATLVTDLQAFDPTATDGSQNIDLVTAISLAVWWAGRLQWSDEVAAAMLPEDDGAFEQDRDGGPDTSRPCHRHARNGAARRAAGA